MFGPGYERRRHVRFDARWAGWIIHAGRRTSCVVANCSNGGAWLDLSVPVGFPTRFVLRVEDPCFIAHCITRHQTATGIGVAFSRVEAQNRLPLGAGAQALRTLPDAAPLARSAGPAFATASDLA